MGDRRVVQSDEIEAYLKHYERLTMEAFYVFVSLTLTQFIVNS